MNATPAPQKPRIGIALGSGSARGWCHIGILQELQRAGIEPEVVCGTSIGALVGAAYASRRLNALDDWVRDINWWDILRFMDPKPNGLAQGGRLMKALLDCLENQPIESLPLRFGAVATELQTGREVWFTQGPLLDAVRSSIALPGLFSPVKHQGRWLVDGGLVNPVPVSLCHALGADYVIAVNLNGDLVGRRDHVKKTKSADTAQPDDAAQEMARPDTPKAESSSWSLGKLGEKLQSTVLGALWERKDSANDDDTPSLFEVFAGATNIMQDRVTRSRLAGDPPDVTLSPRLGRFGLLDFDRAEDAIAVGAEQVRLHLDLIQAGCMLNNTP